MARSKHPAPIKCFWSKLNGLNLTASKQQFIWLIAHAIGHAIAHAKDNGLKYWIKHGSTNFIFWRVTVRVTDTAIQPPMLIEFLTIKSHQHIKRHQNKPSSK